MADQIPIYPRLRGATVLITGASAGIGAACTRAFAANGCRLILGARRVEKVDQLAKELRETYKIEVYTGEIDVRSKESIQRFVAGIPAEYSAIDILVNNAGLALGTAVTWETAEEDIDDMLDTNVKGAVRMIKAIVPGMIARNRGHIINISSVAAHEAYRGGSVYCASKHALDAINTALRKELVHTPLRVTAVSPGLVETEFSLVRFRGDSHRAKAVYHGLTPLTADDVADSVLYAASRPPHVQIAEVLMLATSQASTEVIHRDQTKS